MKTVALATAGLFALAGASLTSAAPASTTPVRPLHQSTIWSITIPAHGRFGVRHIYLPLVDTATGSPTPVTTATPSDTATPEPTPTATGPSYPDAVNLLNTMINKFLLVRDVHFKEVTDGEQTGVDRIHFVASGAASCTGPGLTASIRGTDTVLGTQQVTKAKYSFVQYKAKSYYKDAQTKNTWRKTTKQLPFAPDVSAVLGCGAGSSGGSGSGSGSSGDGCQIKDLSNLGPGSVAGVATWNISATEVCVAGTTTQDATLGFQIAQKSYLLMLESVAIDDPANHITETLKRYRTHFGQKVKIIVPKAGSKTP